MASFIVGLSMVAGATAQTSSTSIQFNKTMRPALSVELMNNTADAEATILERLHSAGYNPETTGSLFWKNNKKDGFYIFNNVSLASVGNKKIDMYFKIVSKNKEEINNSIVYLLLTTGNENFVSPESDPALWAGAESFLQGFPASTTAYSLEQDIKKQETLVTDSRKKIASLLKDGQGIEDKIKLLQADLIKNQSDQAEQQINADLQLKSLNTLKLKRKA
ncbi:hypothetical protein LZZ85_12615 [Terrimonas sp. NA20]|uniref:Uncharacterized protein n=1 Tax=Terrimonas ginsenosidimutans TaxID=2908004 RepID=A0ABS9KS45_9BACT|nr:hypothetical protein [Terrimonas ginsenosidimutans]MCG2615134.1 hypothetical protein [Terrimonas ginsenosidimutans]